MSNAKRFLITTTSSETWTVRNPTSYRQICPKCGAGIENADATSDLSRVPLLRASAIEAAASDCGIKDKEQEKRK